MEPLRESGLIVVDANIDPGARPGACGSDPSSGSQVRGARQRMPPGDGFGELAARRRVSRYTSYSTPPGMNRRWSPAVVSCGSTGPPSGLDLRSPSDAHRCFRQLDEAVVAEVSDRTVIGPHAASAPAGEQCLRHIKKCVSALLADHAATPGSSVWLSTISFSNLALIRGRRDGVRSRRASATRPTRRA